MSEAESASPPSRRGRNCSSEGSRRAATWSPRVPRSRSSPITYSSSAEASIAARCSGEATRPSSSLIAAIASERGSPPGPLDQRRELDQLEVAGDRRVDVVRRCRAASPRAPIRPATTPRAPRRGASGRSSAGPRRGRTAPPRGTPPRRRRARAPRGRCARAPPGPRPAAPATRAPAPRARGVIATWASISRRAAVELLAGLGQRLGEQLVRDPGVLPRTSGDRAAAQAEQIDVVELEPLDLLGLGDQHRAGDRAGRRRRRRARPRRRPRSGGGRSRGPSRAARVATSRRRARRAARG